MTLEEWNVGMMTKPEVSRLRSFNTLRAMAGLNPKTWIRDYWWLPIGSMPDTDRVYPELDEGRRYRVILPCFIRPMGSMAK